MRKIESIKYKIVEKLLLGMARLPYGILYVISDCIYVIMYHIIRYRVSVSRKNIAESFSDKSDQERQQILKKFYRHLSDYIVETIKLLHVSEEEMHQRMVFEGVEQIDESIRQGKSVALYLGHYGNWEYVTSVTRWSKMVARDNVQFGQIYRQLRNEWFDKLFLRIRSRFDSESIEKRETLKALLRHKIDKEQVIIGFMSDQHPSGDDVHHVIQFMGHDTAMITGTEVLIKRMGMDVYYADISKEERGYYKGQILKISTNAKEEAEYAITDAYATMLETTIRRQPELWLWTHKRWKHKCVEQAVNKKALIGNKDE